MAKLSTVIPFPWDDIAVRESSKTFNLAGHSGITYKRDFEASRRLEERQRFRVNKKTGYRPPPHVVPSPHRIVPDSFRMPQKPRSFSPDRKAQHPPNANKKHRSPTRYRSPERRITHKTPQTTTAAPSHTPKQLPSPPKAKQTRETLYPTLSAFYHQQNLDYSPPEPTADYPHTDDLPINNFYPNLNIQVPSENVFDNRTVVSVADNTLVDNQSCETYPTNMNINVSETKVLNDKRVDLNESIVENEHRISDFQVEPSAPPIYLIVPEEQEPQICMSGEDLVRPNRNSFQKKCDASKFIDENTPTIKFVDQRAPIKMSYADRMSEFDIDNPPKSKAEFAQWMTWRKQVNRHMASMILIKQGKDVYVAPSEINRKPLAKTTMKSVIDNSKDKGKITSLGGKPYVMYGIPRAKITG
ncbi:hypothetical protein LOTGIDRAFT_239557 [Lottia gigantea]|uniref:Uncharacterized protein n=1 Tax=Lottia gigantea TaxID=225164 RepID=V4AHT1_LOTGI|nr:hypothetical protein LOTGIDRAFT_239557 [Lottia gigantea]ESO92951.1 hypothetical protein LOTGIDRAFT_239557 [Lottia gigantea]